MDAMREWVTKRVTEMLNFEDEVVVGLAMNLMEEEVRRGKTLHTFLLRHTNTKSHRSRLMTVWHVIR